MSLWSRLVNVFRGDRLIREIDEELESHLAEMVAAGRDPADARRAFGGVLRQREASRDIRRVMWLDNFVMDVRYAMRALRRQPAFFVAAVLSLALGMGANTAIFTLVDAVILRDMPVAEPHQLVQVTKRSSDGREGSLSYPQFEFVQGGGHAFAGVLAQTTTVSSVDISVRGASNRVNATLVTGNYYDVLGVGPAAGRLLMPDDDRATDGSTVAVMSDRYWRRQFSRAPSAIGATFTLNGSVVTLVGVTPPAFYGTLPGTDPDLTFPLSMLKVVRGGNDTWRQRDGFNFLSVMARLNRGVTVEQAAVEVRTRFASRLQSQVVGAPNANERRRILNQRLDLLTGGGGFDRLTAHLSEPLTVLMAMVGLVLLLACGNLSGLLLARAAAREREVLVRCAIGAGRGRLVRQFLTESLVLACLGSAAGMALAAWFTSALVTMVANGGTMILKIVPDWRLFAFLVALTVAVSLLVGLVPSLHAARANVSRGLADARGGARRHLGRALVVGQIAISLVLLVGAALLVETLVKLETLDTGFRRDGILTFGLDTKESSDSPHRQTVESTLLQRLNGIPGVEATSAVQILFISGGGWNGSVHVDGYASAPNEELIADFNAVAPNFFRTMGTPILAGRDFDDRDGRVPPSAASESIGRSGRVAIVNESFARAYFSNRSPLGGHLSIAGGPAQYEIVGVAKDAKYLNVKETFPKIVYLPLGQKRLGPPTLLISTTTGNPRWVVPRVEAVLRGLDPTMRLSDVHTFADHVDRSILNERLLGMLGAFFGGLALIVACLGVFGVLAFSVAQRTREFGIRMALGATRGGLTAHVLRDVFIMLFVGSIVGVAAAASLTRIGARLLYGVTPTDPAVFAAAMALLAAGCVLAGVIPARRAARVDPLVALRHD